MRSRHNFLGEMRGKSRNRQFRRRAPKYGAGHLAVWAVVAAFALAPAWAQSPPASQPKRFTLAKDTTVITTPLNKDGTPDYVGALNARYSQGVTPENNAFTAWIEIVGTRPEDGNLATRAIDRVLALSGANATPEEAAVWKTFDQYCLEQSHDQARADALHGEMIHARLELWTDAQHPEFAAYLKANEDWLTKIAAAAARPKWWSPAVSVAASDRSLMIATLLPSLGRLREAGQVFAGRATGRAAAGDIDGALQDIFTIKRLGRHVQNAPTTIEKLVGAAINGLADEALGTIAGAGRLNEAQCAAVEKALASLPLRTPMRDVLDVGERWELLDSMLYFLSGEKEDQLVDIFGPTVDGGEDPAKKQFATMQFQELDWDVMLRLANKTCDGMSAADQAQSFTELRRVSAEQESLIAGWAKERGASDDLRKHADESRPEYSARMARAFMSLMVPSLDKVIELDRADQVRDLAADVLLAAAREKARTGHWPATLQEMVPGALKEVPIDWFSADGKSPLKYVVTAQGTQISSVHRRGSGATPTGPEDIVVGCQIEPASTDGLP